MDIKNFYIPVEWKMYDILEIQAETLEQAIEKAFEMPLTDGNYLETSFEIDYESLNDYNKGDK